MDSRLVNKYFSFVDEISDKFEYDSNIKHLLYLIVPAFVTKYSIFKESLVLNTFRDIPIIVNNDSSNLYVKAFYTSIPKYDGDNIITEKFIVLNDYKDISLVQLLDSLVHEFNHAINSYEKDISIKDNYLYLRTGLTYAIYSTLDLKAIKKDDSYVLEEILNTHQTEEIINLIKNYSDTERTLLNNVIYSLNNETDKDYSSFAYSLENMLMKSVLDNKTFISTLNNLRITGDVLDIQEWFDNIVGSDGSYERLNQCLKKIMNLEKNFSNRRLFKNIVINKIKDLMKELLDIINTFNQNCNYK